MRHNRKTVASSLAVEVTSQRQAPSVDVTRRQAEAAESTVLLPLVLLEPEPTLSPSRTPTPDPASFLPTRLQIPAIGLDAPIIQVGWETQVVNGQLASNWNVPDTFAAGWHATSAAPVQPGNTVLNGHNNIFGKVFRDLEDLQPGDEVTVYSGETLHHYMVTERHILKEKYKPTKVRQQNAQFIMPTEDERLILVTCWPYTSNTYRLVIVALPPTPARGTTE